MRMPRLKPKDRTNVFHCISRTVGGQRLLDPTAQEEFLYRMRRQAAFAGLEILTHCVMENHFHILVRVPAPADLEDLTIMERVQGFYGKTLPVDIQAIQKDFSKNGCLTDQDRQRFLARMGDLSVFMKELLQGFSRWFNRRNDRFGTLWADRFKSLLAEDQPTVLETLGAYIDLNPVRAGLVSDPGEYRFCGYAEAETGNREARSGLCSALGLNDWAVARKHYRESIFTRAGQTNHPAKCRLEPDVIRKMLRNGEDLQPGQALRIRIRYLTDGLILGTPVFVEQIFTEFRFRFGPNRKTGGRRLMRLPFGHLRTARDLKKRPLD